MGSGFNAQGEGGSVGWRAFLMLLIFELGRWESRGGIGVKIHLPRPHPKKILCADGNEGKRDMNLQHYYVGGPPS